ncbi:relaxase domain-containing protein [Streptomyces sp. NPDC058758]|uniref:relaxase domain-containing protein n=1 Tax=Streptomyces sp. NPDC058758 TaxID=3346627 RepID=UPI0036C4D464
MDLVFRAPPTAHIAWALTDDETRLVLESCQDVARDKTLAWLKESVAQIRWGSGGKHRRPVKDGLVVAVFRHYEFRAAESKPLLHDHAVVSIRARRPDGTRATSPPARCWPTSSRPTPSTPSTSWRRCPSGSGGRGSRAR